MDGISAGGGLPAALSAEGTANLTLLKKSQDLMETQAAALIATLPQASPPPPNPPGVGGRVDVTA
jgi:hypothetical protein